MGRLLAAAAFHRGLTPDAVTGLSACCTAVGIAAIALAPHTWVVGILVATCLVVGYALDAADGQLARLRGGGSPAGEWLDHMVDAAKSASLHQAVLVGLYRREDVDHAWLLIPLAFCVVDVVHFFATLLNEALRSQHGATTRSTPTEGRPSVLRSVVVLPTDYGVLCLVFVLLGSPVAFLSAYGLMLVGTAGYLFLALPHWRSEMVRLGARALPATGTTAHPMR
ncbi:CDP-alcohol phosphatidyltransferase family protein [Geodermatophilus marinus]|uniref:CDP-alcohol phosphatidyltransferase family protein n=1 Tax=Geodermatophilus sp. LHW52908 TaxID=2303986 RepID=UPI001F1F10A3|nr:CDP-alcohol phosphatidyltransferase family protein [Geodermatophilus sp. LHW52908]